VRSVQRVVREIVLGSDTTTIRILLANASLLWAIMMLTQPGILLHPSFDIMMSIASKPVWVIAFLLHFVGVYWKAYNVKSKGDRCMITNGYGFMLWFFTTVSTNYYVGAMDPGTALEIVICGASAWALYKTGSLADARNPI